MAGLDKEQDRRERCEFKGKSSGSAGVWGEGTQVKKSVGW